MTNACDILNQLHDADVDWMVAVGRKRAVAAGQCVVEEGRGVDDVFFVLDGRFNVTVGECRSLATIEAGEVIGEMSFLDHHPPVATVTALVDSTIFALPKPALARKMSADLPFAARFYSTIGQYVTQRLRRTIGAIGGADRAGIADRLGGADGVGSTDSVGNNRPAATPPTTSPTLVVGTSNRLNDLARRASTAVGG